MLSPNKNILIISLFWILISLFSLGQEYLYARVREEVFYPWEALSFKIGWLLYIPVTLAVFRLGTWLPFNKVDIAKAVPLHVISSVVLSLLYTISFAFLLTFFWNQFIYPVAFAQMWEKVLAANLLYSFLMYWLILGGYLAFSAFRQIEQLQLEREKTEKLLLSSRLSALKMQLEPHFLFNVHHSVISLMQKGEIKQAMAMLLKVSDLLRMSLKETSKDLVPIRQEVDLLRLYMDIQQIRFKDRLEIKWCVAEELMHALVPPMLLQPIAENAIKHGVEPYAKKGIVQIKIESRKKNLQILVQDNGQEGAIFSPLTLGIGLTNTKERLAHLFADNQQFTIDRNPQEAGVRVQITIPLLLPSD